MENPGQFRVEINISVNERAGALLSEIDTDGEPIALSANESHIYELPGGKRLTIAASPIYTPMFMRYCAMMRRTDLLVDPRFATAHLRRANLAALLAEVRAWILSFDGLEQLQMQVSEGGLAVGEIRSITEFAKMDWVKEWNAIVEVDDRNGGTTPMPGAPWIFSDAELPAPGAPAFQGEHNAEICAEANVAPETIQSLKDRRILLSRRSITGAFD
jgi:crotonobetainyl-CoA:carnitine CoA-transferase CaiB-like acyl-CoA transferase